MTERVRAFWVTAPGVGEIRPAEIAPPRAGEVLVRALKSGISRGSESLVFAGRVPKSQYQAMRCPCQDGDFPAPVKYGYASVGVVEAGPPALLGRRVFCLYPHQDRYVVPEAMVLPVPDPVPDARAVLAANMETALNGLWDGGPLLGDRITVVGAGTVGSLMAALAARLPVARVELIDIDANRAALAAALGCSFALPEAARGDADLVVHASGSGAGLATALRLAGFEATVLEMSWYGERLVPVPLGGPFHSRRLKLVSSQVGKVAPSRRATTSHRQRLEQAIALLADARLDALLAPAVPFVELPDRLPDILNPQNGVLCQLIAYP